MCLPRVFVQENREDGRFFAPLRMTCVSIISVAGVPGVRKVHPFKGKGSRGNVETMKKPL